MTFTATVAASSGTGTPTGTVTFMDGTTTIGSPVTLTAGVASVSTSTLTAGPHSITAVYAGDTNFATSTSTALTQTVNQALDDHQRRRHDVHIGAGTFMVTTSGYPIAALTTGTLPTGVTFMDNSNGTGTLTGTGVTADTYPLTITATNSVSSVNQSFTLTVT